jgi:DNA-binding XRE family transcriptional regulator
MMDKGKRDALEAAGFRVGTVDEFLGLDEQDRQFVELRVAVALAVRRARRRKKMTQAQLARAIGSTQARIAKMEAGSGEVSLDLMFRGLFGAGGTLADLDLDLDMAGPAKGASISRSGGPGKVRATRE